MLARCTARARRRSTSASRSCLHGRNTAPVVVSTAGCPADRRPAAPLCLRATPSSWRAGRGLGSPLYGGDGHGPADDRLRLSGNLAFMHDGNSFLVDGELVPVAEAGPNAIPRSIAAIAGSSRTSTCSSRRPHALRAARTKGETRTELLERFGPGIIAEHIAALTDDAPRPASASSRTAVWRGDFGSRPLARRRERRPRSPRSSSAKRGQIVPAREGRRPGAHGDRRRASPGQWPPSFEPPSEGPFVLYQPWEYGCDAAASWVDSIRDARRRGLDSSERRPRRSFVTCPASRPALVHVSSRTASTSTASRPDGA